MDLIYEFPLPKGTRFEKLVQAFAKWSRVNIPVVKA